MINKKVIHKKYGKGIITEIANNRIQVFFSEEDKTVKFQYPNAFEQFLEFKDSKLQSDVKNKIIELKSAKIEKLYNTVKKVNSPKDKKSRSAQDKGNIAIKCTFCNGGESVDSLGFAGLCDEDNIRTNIKAGRSLCNKAECKNFYDNKITYEQLLEIYKNKGSMCYESIMLTDWIVYAGVHNSGKYAGQPKKFREVSKNGITFLTTKFPGTKEQDRVIFGAYIIEEYFEGNNEEEGYIAANLDYCIQLSPEEAKKCKFWEFYYNNKNPERIQFGSALHKYFSNNQTMQILEKICEVKKGTNDEKQAKLIYDKYSDLNSIEVKNITKPMGPLVNN